MNELLKRLLASTAVFAPDTGGSAGGDPPEDDLDLDQDDDPVAEGDDEPEDQVDAAEDDDEDDDGGADDPPPRQPSRGERRFQTLTNEVKTERERALRLERELQQLREQQNRGNSRQSEEEEAQRLALMTVEERVEYKLNKALESHRRESEIVQFRSVDAQDKATFDGRYRAHPKYGKYCDEVEAELAKSRAAGVNVQRETVLAALIGRRVLAKTTSAPPARRAEAQRRLKRNETRPADARGGEARGRRGVQSLEERLSDVTF